MADSAKNRPALRSGCPWLLSGSSELNGLSIRYAHVYKPMSRVSRPVQWTKLLAATVTIQAAIQVVALAGGLIAVQLLPTEEYALYTLSNTVLATMALLVDGGLANGAMAQGGRVWQDRAKLGSVLVSALALRRQLAIVSLLLGVPALLALLRNHGAGWGASLLLVASVTPAFLASLSGSIVSIASRLHQDIASLQRIEFVAALGRTMGLGVALREIPYAWTAIAISGVSQFWVNVRLRGASRRYVLWDQKYDPESRRELVSVAKRVFPSSLYYCLSANVTIWLISLLGTTQAVAQVGALGRLAMMLNLFSAILSILVFPRMARLPMVRKLLIARFVQVHVVVSLIGAFAVLATHLYPTEVLWLLGRHYEMLTGEVPLAVAGGAAGLLATTSFSVCAQRGYIISPPVNIGISIFSLCLILQVVDPSTVRGILLFGVLNGLTQSLIWATYFLVSVSRARPQADIHGGTQ